MTKNEIEKKAINILEKYNINKIPVNIEMLTKKIGIELFKEKLPEDISAVLDLRKNPILLVNSDHHENRQRFSIAHELGHYILHHTSGIHIDKRTYFRNSISALGLDKIEIEANQFASELLMPTELINTFLSYYEDLIDSNEDVLLELAKRCKVSTTAISYKLINIGYI